MEESTEMTQRSWWNVRSWLRWRPTSLEHLRDAEKKIFDHVNTPVDRKFVSISNGCKDIWTVVANKDHNGLPMVMVHGFGGGTGLWAQNIDPIAQKSSLYMMDLLGFGQSSRPKFSKDALDAETEFVDSLEEWRSKMNLDKFILLGHSLGAFVVSSYTMKHPERVKHLVLVDPWGFPEKPQDSGKSLPFWIRTFIAIVKPFNPLAILRAAGPWGPGLVRKFRSDIGKKFASIINEELMLDYIYHCNAQNPSGEVAFKTMTQSLGWAVNPMISRISQIHPDIPISMIYGSRSWINSDTGNDVRMKRPNSYVDVQIVKGAGHHVYADKPEDFNVLISSICDSINSESPLPSPAPLLHTDTHDQTATQLSDGHAPLLSKSQHNNADDLDLDVMMALGMDDGADLVPSTSSDSLSPSPVS